MVHGLAAIARKHTPDPFKSTGLQGTALNASATAGLIAAPYAVFAAVFASVKLQL